MDAKDEHRAERDERDNSETDIVETAAEINNAINRKKIDDIIE
jgi:hypothetical protein